MGISMWQLLIVLLIVVLLFGTKRLKNIGGDLGSAIKGFKKAVNENEENAEDKPENAKLEQKTTDEKIIEGTAQRTEKSETKNS